MPLAYWCVFVAAALPYLWTVLAKSRPDYNNRKPREFLLEVDGWRKRANWAQMNAWEAFAPFAAAVIIAVTRNGEPTWVNGLSVVFIVFRVAHGVAYILDNHVARSLCWVGGIACVLGLFVTAMG